MSYRNPVLPGFFPDPSVCRVGDDFYLVNSSLEYFPGLPVHVSQDLVSWHPLGAAVDRIEQLPLAEAPDSGGLFAPTIRHHDGVFYLACTFIPEGDIPGPPPSGSFYLTADDAAGPWSDPYWLPEADGIDASLFFDEDGTAWWHGCRPIEDPQWPGRTEIWLRELDLAAGRLVGPEHVIWTGAMRNSVWSEGPHLYRRDGWYYLLTAEGGTAFEHSVMVARSRELTGPYAGCPANPVFTHRQLGHNAAVQNVGHADLVEAPDGSWWAVMLGTRPLDGHHLFGRETFLTPVSWQNDWPVFNPGIGLLSESGPSLPVPKGAAARSRAAELLTDATTPPISPRGLPGFSGRRLDRWQAQLSETVTVAPDATGGLMLWYSSTALVRVEASVEDGSWQLRAVSLGGGEGWAHAVGLSVDADAPLTADFGAEFFGLALHLWARPVGGARVELGDVDARLLSTESNGGFTGVVAGPFVTTARPTGV